MTGVAPFSAAALDQQRIADADRAKSGDIGCMSGGDQWTPAQMSAEATRQVNDEAELHMLREFYSTWCAFHATPNDELHRYKKGLKAQHMVDTSKALNNFYAVNP